MNDDQLRNILARACEKAGSIRKWAKQNKFSAAFVCDVLNRNRDFSDRLLESIGYKREIKSVVTFRKSSMETP